MAMNLPPAPSSVDVLLFDLGRVVLDISFEQVMTNWAQHAGCEPADRYVQGLAGSLRIARDPSGQLVMSACIDASESATMPHPVLHSMQLWVPSVTAH